MDDSYTTSNSSNSNIPILLGSENYDFWRNRMLFNLRSYNAANIVLGKEPVPKSPESSPSSSTSGADKDKDKEAEKERELKMREYERKLTSWTSRDNKAAGLIGSTVSVVIEKRFLDPETQTAHEMWKILETNFKSESLMLVYHHRRRLKDFNWNSDASIRKNIDDFMSIITDLHKAGHVITELDQAMDLIMSLPRTTRWESAVNQLLIMLPKSRQDLTTSDGSGNRVQFSFELIERRLMEEATRDIVESQIQANAQGTEHQETAMFSQRRNGKGKSRTPSKGMKVNAPPVGSSPSSDCKDCPNGKCNHCSKWNHCEMHCYKRITELYHAIPRSDKGRTSQQPRQDHQAHVSQQHSDCGDERNCPPGLHFAMMCHVDSALTTQSDAGLDSWIIDSGTTSHICRIKSKFSSLRPYPDPKPVIRVGTSDTAEIIGIGDATFHAYVNGQSRTVTLHDVFYVPTFSVNLISTRQLTKKGCRAVEFGNTYCIYDPNDNLAFMGVPKGGLWVVDPRKGVDSDEPISLYTKKLGLPIRLLHRRFGHISEASVRRLASRDMVLDIAISNEEVAEEEHVCAECLAGKQHRFPFPEKATYRASRPIECIHSDLHGPLIKSIGGYRYFATFIDDFSRRVTVIPLKKKSDTFTAFKNYLTANENRFSAKGFKVQYLQSDRGGEFLSNEFTEFLLARGITRRLRLPDTPEQNGVAERYMRTIVETTICMLNDAHLPPCFWEDAVKTAAHIINRSPTKSLTGMVPEEAFSGTKPSVDHLRVFGCTAHTLVEKTHRSGTRLDPHSKPMIFVGYSAESKGYLMRDPKTLKLVASRHVIFNEFTPGVTNKHPVPVDKLMEHGPDFTIVPLGPGSETLNGDEVSDRDADDIDTAMRVDLPPNTTPDLSITAVSTPEGPTPNSPGDMSPSSTTSPSIDIRHLHFQVEQDENMSSVPDSATEPTIPPPRYPTRGNRLPPVRYEAGASHFQMHSFLCDNPDKPPRSLKDALKRDDAAQWIAAAQEEWQNCLSTGTFKLVKRPRNRNVIRSHAILTLKHNQFNFPIRYKVRIVAGGNGQIEGEDFTKTYSSVAKFTSSRTVLAFAAAERLQVFQFDVKHAYLNGDLDEEVFMEIPDGFEIDGYPRYEWVLDLEKGLYGLKQAGRIWWFKLRDKLKTVGFIQCLSDPCVYYRHEEDKSITRIAVHVDDGLGAAKSHLISQIKTQLQSLFDITFEEHAQFFLGVAIQQDSDGSIYLSQKGYIDKMLTRFGYDSEDTNNKPTPLAENAPLSSQLCPPKDSPIDKEKYPYLRLIGCLNYAAVATRPDIAFAVSSLAQYSSNPGVKHWHAAVRVLRYLKSTSDWKLCFRAGSPLVLQGYSDSDWAGNIDSRKSTSGYVFRLAGCTISWSSKKQSSVALSSCEAEYIALTHASKELLWLRNLLEELGLSQSQATTLFGDNLGAKSLSENAIQSNRSKHIDIRYHFLRERIELGYITLKYLKTSEQMADVMTKPLGRILHQRFCQAMGLVMLN